MQRTKVLVGLALLLGQGALGVVGCSDDADEPAASAGAGGSAGTAGSGGAAAGTAGSAGSGNTGPEDQVYPAPVGPSFADLKPGWNTMLPGGDTACSKGSPFTYFVRPGATDKVVIEFSGGGACWSDATCPLADSAAIFTSTVETPSYVTDEATAKGISDHTRDDNPVKDWTHVYIGYCTGDIHAGNNVKEYTDSAATPPAKLTINHKGAVNTRSVLSWVFANVPNPQKVLMTGCSAGGYGATFWAPHVKRHYSQARIYHFSDSAAGIVSPSFFSEITESWKPQGVYPTYIPGSDPSTTAKLSTFYTAVSAFYPDLPLSQFNSQTDSTQALYYQFVTSGDKNAWSKLMLEEMAAIRGGASNFGAYLAPGSKHCVLPFDEFYTLDVEGKKVAGWLNDTLNDQKPADVTCPTCK